MTGAPQQKQTMRLAMRSEGTWWVAYVAKPSTMDGAVEIGRIALTAVQDKRRKDAFMEICVTFMADMIRDATGAAIDDWRVQPAPEHEKAGRA